MVRNSSRLTSLFSGNPPELQETTLSSDFEFISTNPCWVPRISTTNSSRIKMPLIEELPVTTTIRASHGWTYVPDTGAPTPAVQLGSRKRGRDGTTTATSHSSAYSLSAKQEKAIQQRLNDLNRENYRETNIPIPKRDGARSIEKKQTPNVKRILAYSRTFQHYLANEEAGVNVYGAAGNAPSATVRSNIAEVVTKPQKPATDSRPRTAAQPAASTPTQKGGTRRTSSLRHSKTAPVKSETALDEDDLDIEMTDTATQQQSSSPIASQKSPSSSRQMQQVQPSSPSSTQMRAPLYDPALDHDPLLRTLDLPKMPSERVMQELLAEPPLSYTAARAKPLNQSTGPNGSGTSFIMRTGNSTLTAKPGRWFCAVCGYWGKVRCKYGCGERVCGLLECWKGHEAVCSLAATAY